MFLSPLGKTTFVRDVLLPSFKQDQKIFIQTRDEQDFANLPQVTFLQEKFDINQESLDTIPEEGFVFLDDYTRKDKSADQFNDIVNFHLR